MSSCFSRTSRRRHRDGGSACDPRGRLRQDRNRARRSGSRARAGGVDVEPGPHPDRPWLDRQGHHGPSGKQSSGSHESGCSIWWSSGLNDLAETPGVAHECDKDDGNLKIGARSHRVSGQHAEAARIGVHLRPDGDLHGEVGDPAVSEERIQR